MIQFRGLPRADFGNPVKMTQVDLDADHCEGRQLQGTVQQLECRVCDRETGFGKFGFEQPDCGGKNR